MSPDDFRAHKLNNTCTSCGNYGHWACCHLSNRQIENKLPRFPPNSINRNVKHRNSNTNNQTNYVENNNKSVNRRTRVFMNTVSNKSSLSNVSFWNGPLLVDCEPYSPICMTEILWLKCVDAPSSIKLDLMPITLQGCTWWKFGTGWF